MTIAADTHSIKLNTDAIRADLVIVRGVTESIDHRIGDLNTKADASLVALEAMTDTLTSMGKLLVTMSEDLKTVVKYLEPPPVVGIEIQPGTPQPRPEQ